MKQFKMLLLASMFILFNACGGGGSSADNGTTAEITPETPKSIAIDKIKTYADDSTLATPTVEDYTDAGVIGVNAQNISDINAVVVELSAEEVDTPEEIQALVDNLGVIPALSLTLMSVLHDDVKETSGLLKIEGKLYTHNDSGDSDLLYEINPSTGEVIRSITIHGATNVDWEDLASDANHLYIADIGNNRGDRRDLKIYKILKNNLNENSTVNAETISFSYSDQSIFDYDNFTTPYDAEALIVYNAKLYIFTKNWADYTSKVYSMPTTPGHYVVTSHDKKILNVMVTGAAIDESENSVALIGYTNPYDNNRAFQSMIITLSDFSDNHFFSGSINEYPIKTIQGVAQAEAILFNTSSQLYLSSESVTVQSIEFPAKLYKAEIIK